MTPLSQPQSDITQKRGVHTDLLTGREREHWILQHFRHFELQIFVPQWREHPLTGNSHPWTNTSVGETFEELSGPLVHTNFPRNWYGPMALKVL